MDERELIQKSVAGDEKAFAHLFEYHRGMIFRHCLSIVHDQEIAEDLTQETFVHAYQNLAGFRLEARFSTWVWRISHNLSLSYIKKHPFLEQEFREEILPPQFVKKESVDEEKILKIREAMRQLSPKHQLVFEMYVFKHIPQKKIAAELGIAYGTVRSRIHYARKRIIQFLQKA